MSNVSPSWKSAEDNVRVFIEVFFSKMCQTKQESSMSDVEQMNRAVAWACAIDANDVASYPEQEKPQLFFFAQFLLCKIACE